MDSSPDARLARALDSLECLSVGDAFGEQFFMSFEMVTRLLDRSELWEGPRYSFEDEFIQHELITKRCLEFCAPTWRWTDDTALSVEIVAELRDNGEIYPDSLAERFTRRFLHDPNRTYGASMHSLLPRLVSEGWQKASQSLFNAHGSYGNGSAMRVAPLGAYFADDFELLVEQARLSAVVTHAHEEAVAGAIATALAAGICARLREEGNELTPRDFLEKIIGYVPNSEVQERLVQCLGFSEDIAVEQAAFVVGSGMDVACQDTVPFCCWCAANYCRDFAEAMWATVSGLGDRDTTCAIVGGVVGARLGKEAIPAQWYARREPLSWL